MTWNDKGATLTKKKSGIKFGARLQDAVENLEKWPTPNQRDHMGKRRKLTNGENISKTTGTKFGLDLNQAVEKWPTPDATNVSDGVPWEISKKQLDERRKRTKQAMKEGRVKAGSGRSPNLAMKVQREIAHQKNWATPNTMDYLPPKEGEAMERIYETHRKGRTSPSNLREQVNPKSWPTPQVGEEKASRPGGTQNQVMLSHIAIGLQDQDKSNTNGKSQEFPEPPKMKLNPNWVEQIMGLPVGWTQLPTEWID